MKKPECPATDEQWIDYLADEWDSYREDEVAQQVVDMARPALVALLCLRFLVVYEPPLARAEVLKLYGMISQKEHV